ncbi:MAG: oligosaccharide flippase family protein [Bacteroidota bacterium]
MKRIAIISSISGLAQVVVNIGLLLVVIRVLIHALGLPAYGIYALITAMGGLGVFANFGFNTSLIKYLSEQGQTRESSYDIVVTLMIIGGASLLVAVGFIASGAFILTSVLNVPVEMITPSVNSLYIACIAMNFFQMVSQVPSAVLDAAQKIYVTNSVQLATGVLGKLGIIVSLLVSPSLSTVGWIMLTSSVITAAFLFSAAAKAWGNLSCPGVHKHFLGVARKHFLYSRSVYATSIMGFFYEPVSKVLISQFVGLAEVGFFDLAVRAKGFVWSVLERLVYPVLPMIARQLKPDDSRTLIEEVQQKLLIIIAPMLVATIFLSSPLVTVWIGATLLPAVVGVMCIVSCYLLALPYVPVYQFLQVKGYPHKTLVLQSANVGVNLLAFLLLVPFFGYYGAVAGFCLAILTSIGLSVRYQWKILRSNPWTSWGSTVGPLKLVSSLFVLNLCTLPFDLPVGGRVTILLVLNVGATILLLRWLKVITAQDVDRYVGRDSRVGVVLEKLLVSCT